MIGDMIRDSPENKTGVHVTVIFDMYSVTGYLIFPQWFVYEITDVIHNITGMNRLKEYVKKKMYA